MRDLLVIVFAALLISMLLKTFLVRSFYIPSSSMENTLQVEDRVMVNQLVPNIVPVKRGDVIVFKDPGGWLYGHPKTAPSFWDMVMQFVGLQPDTSNDYLIKRVIGVGGDRVMCCNASGRLMVNDVEIIEPYIQTSITNPAASGVLFDVTVPENAYWVLGDNRYSSQDSRYQQQRPGKGFVPKEDVVGRAFLLNWPFNRFGILGNYPETFEDIPDKDQ